MHALVLALALAHGGLAVDEEGRGPPPVCGFVAGAGLGIVVGGLIGVAVAVAVGAVVQLAQPPSLPCTARSRCFVSDGLPPGADAGVRVGFVSVPIGAVGGAGAGAFLLEHVVASEPPKPAVEHAY